MPGNEPDRTIRNPAVPPGLWVFRHDDPGVETPGYCRVSLRDIDTPGYYRVSLRDSIITTSGR